MYRTLLRPLFFRMDPERAHHFVAGLGNAISRSPLIGKGLRNRQTSAWPSLRQDIAGISFPNPTGIAAGFDKNAQFTTLLQAMGFGYAEYGSITAKPSAGNPSPRLFRLVQDKALINRMGLNNEGASTICRRLHQLRTTHPTLFRDFPSGINIAKTHDACIMGDDAIRDYVSSYLHARDVADYITLNISCPNTGEGKTFEEPGPLADLLDAIGDEQTDSLHPLFVKFSPDNDFTRLDQLVTICEERNITGYIVSNTSTDRSGLLTPEKKLSGIGRGGLSGAPLFSKTMEYISWFRRTLPNERILIACGGIDSPEKAVSLIKEGAHLLQVYTGLVYEGPGLIRRINNALAMQVKKEGAASLSELRNAD